MDYPVMERPNLLGCPKLVVKAGLPFLTPFAPVSNNGINPVYAIVDDLLVPWVTGLDMFNVTFWQQSLV